jgi:hypothetical protein
MSKEFNMKLFDVSVVGFGSIEPFITTSRGKAFAAAYRAFCSYSDVATFKEFLKIARVRKSDRQPPKRFGDEISVMGLRAFYVGRSGQYIEFVKPNDDYTLLSHPSDVEFVNPEGKS